MAQASAAPRRAANFFAQLMSVYSIKNQIARPLGLGLALIPLLALGRTGLRAEPAPPLQPLAEFLRAGAQRSFDSREAMQLAAQRQQELLNAYAKLAPAVSATSSYTRNQYQVEVNIPVFAGGMPTGMSSTAVITPQDQVDAVFSLSVPLISERFEGSIQAVSSRGATSEIARTGRRAVRERLITGCFIPMTVTEVDRARMPHRGCSCPVRPSIASHNAGSLSKSQVQVNHTLDTT